MHESETAADNRSPVKVALAIGLAIVFAVVVVVQTKDYWPGGQTTDSAKANGSAADWLDADGFRLSGLDRIVGDEESDGRWPKVLLSECIRYDPFATPDGFILKSKKPIQQDADSGVLQTELEIAKKRATQEEVISSLRDAGVNAILKGPEQSTAIVGTQLVRVGEEVEGFRVLAIEPDGIVIERPGLK